MSQFRTVIKPQKQVDLINYQSNIMLVGSCFTEHISQKLDYFKFNTLTNPFGILFNSSALKISIEQCVLNKKYTLSDLGFYNDLWYSFNHHSQFSNTDIDKTLSEINSGINQAHQFIKTASHIVITLGTAWVFTDKQSGKIVANCHKLPQQNFIKSLQSSEAILVDLDEISKIIASINPNVKLLFTVSPVRHLRNGFAENMLSKAHLISAVHQHINQHQNNFYIPAYEIMMDDLRDYRFYKTDMIHPNQTAVDYIWNYFKNSWLSDKEFTTMKEVDSIQKDLQHRPFNKASESHQKFKLNLDKKITNLITMHPEIGF